MGPHLRGSGDEFSASGPRAAFPAGGLAAEPHRGSALRRRDPPAHRGVRPEDGYPIVLAHGITCAIRVWAYQIAELAGNFRVIAFDHRGHGRSGIPRRGGYSLSHLAADVDACLTPP